MGEESLITEEMRASIGKVFQIAVNVVERGMLKRYVEAIGDTNPLWQDEEYARKTEYGGIIAPPSLVATIYMRGGSMRNSMPFEMPLKRGVDSGAEWEFYKPIRVGDVIVTLRKWTNFYEKKGRLGPMIFYIGELSFINQRGELVAIERDTHATY